jgi:hemerythrin-like metal-binding protein
MRSRHVTWRANIHATSVEELDRQHRELFRRINLLLDALDTDEADDAVRNMMAFLEKYMGEHFACEEDEMDARRCAGCQLNVAEHHRFARVYGQLRKRLARDGVTQGLTIDLKQLLLTWTDTHVPRVDAMLRDAGPRAPERVTA